MQLTDRHKNIIKNSRKTSSWREDVAFNKKVRFIFWKVLGIPAASRDNVPSPSPLQWFTTILEDDSPEKRLEIENEAKENSKTKYGEAIL